MALIADDAGDRAAQILILTESLRTIVEADTALVRARRPLAEGAAAEEKQRLVNAYRLEMTRISQDPALIKDAPRAALDALTTATQALQAAVAEHAAEVAAVKAVSEGLVQAIAQEVNREAAARRGYAPHGGLSAGMAAPAVAIDRKA
jgi:predicted nucleic acid-binding protein